MPTILQWPPILWTLRFGLLIVLTGSAAVFLLLVARFFRWKHLKALLRADLPRIRSVGGEFAGTKATVQLADEVLDDRFDVLIARIDQLQATLNASLEAQARRARRKTR